MRFSSDGRRHERVGRPHSWTAEGRSARLAAAARRESALFLVGTGAIAIHVVDDNFLQPQPGTSAGDHLVSGLVPLAVLALAAATHSHLRAGLRATIALTLGLIGTVAGAGEAGYYTIKIGPSGDDYTGLLAILAGLLLMAVGRDPLEDEAVGGDPAPPLPAPFAARGRRGGGAVYVVFPVASSYVYTHVARPSVPAANLGAPYEGRDLHDQRRHRARRLVRAVQERRDGDRVPRPLGAAAARPMLIRHGYGVLLFDPRGEGESEGDPYRWGGERDVKAALAFVGRPDVDRGRIGGLGLSLGGELLLQTAAESNALKAVVSEGAGMRSIREHWRNRARRSGCRRPRGRRRRGHRGLLEPRAAAGSDRAREPDRAAPRVLHLLGSSLGGEELNRKFYAAAGEPRRSGRTETPATPTGLPPTRRSTSGE